MFSGFLSGFIVAAPFFFPPKWALKLHCSHRLFNYPFCGQALAAQMLFFMALPGICHSLILASLSFKFQL